jgi:telomerase reverse transcriptase
VTDDYDVARRFVNTMSGGFPEYGAHISPSKTVLSFELAHGGQAIPVVSVRDDGRKCELH